MKPRRLREISAAVWLGVGVMGGVSALNSHDEAIKAEEIAATLEDSSQAAEWRAYADSEEADLSRALLLVTVDLGVIGVSGAVNTLFIAASRRREQESEPETETNTPLQ